jgi:hypothetical protein
MTIEPTSPEQRQVLEAQSSTVSSQKSSAPGVIRPQVVARREPASPIAKKREMVLPEPSSSPATVRVTIGRVEVRAVPPPESFPPSASPARRGPALSLDDYLKQRNEGQR